MNKQAKKATSRIWSHYGGQILSREAFTTFGGFSDIVDPIIQQAIDAALAEQALPTDVRGLVDALEYIAQGMWEHLPGRTWAGSGMLYAEQALSTYRAGKPTLPAEVVEFPQATEEDRANGWSLNRKFLGEVKTRASEEVVSLDGIVSVEKITSLEQVECVLLAARAALLAPYTPQGAKR